ncbi:MAG TPA: glutamine--fructose-6-phosphate transaminase (isomerizing) [bacterium]|nr:glutamine--fructose-6-phosphate transaminase (isomerizing) [bacterium]HOY45483.1 glutamine--fructose-6-phosphate transaminase (isomerizing) [bacterium]HPG84164.1 glutamine--fructose-6-phosphate transaminase (isomerizing) [bacterium]HPM60427.1 glutamine--fructose-6-phosphate transaminase (isomerizing) [bacterium]
MCGIVGYIGSQNALPLLLNGLHRLEYRGYDSAGVALWTDEGIWMQKAAGKIAELERILPAEPPQSTLGIGHTRWATHGEPNSVNAHPHCDCGRRIAVVHNGIIENFPLLRDELIRKGHTFQSQTDSEVLCHLFEEYLERGMELGEAVRQGLACVQGTYGLAIIDRDHPDTLVAARNGSPLVIGHGEEEFFLASDAAPLVGVIKSVTYLDDGELAVLTRSGMTVRTIENCPVDKHSEPIDLDLQQIEKSGYAHFMLKEIMEQPSTLADTLRGRLMWEEGTARLGGIEHDFESLLYARRIVLTACGTSWHSALIGEFMFEEMLGIPVEVEYASEFRYRNPIVNDDSVVIAISQSGETADTLAAIREAKRKRSKVYGICNVVGSSIARETDAGVYLHAGPEIGVASTKAFTSQVTVLALITLLLGRMRSISSARGRELVSELQAIPGKIRTILEQHEEIRQIAEIHQYVRNCLYLGRGYNYPVALEGALKLKEIAYVHAEGYPAAEIKHGPIALIDNQMPVVVIATRDSIYEKILSNIEEVRARSGRVIAIATEGDQEIKKHAQYVIYVPQTIEMLSPLLTIIPLQLFAYYMAILRNCDVDQPRNLAKSVTVE